MVISAFLAGRQYGANSVGGRHECYETFYELYEYVCISLEAIVDHGSHPHVYSSLSFTWDRETKTKA